MKRLIYLPLMALLLWLQGCVTDDFGVNVRPNDDVGTSYKVLIESTIDQHDNTRVDDSGFCTGDDAGIYLVNYDGDTPGELLVEDNQADNVKFTLGEDVLVITIFSDFTPKIWARYHNFAKNCRRRLQATTVEITPRLKK